MRIFKLIRPQHEHEVYIREVERCKAIEHVWGSVSHTNQSMTFEPIKGSILYKELLVGRMNI